MCLKMVGSLQLSCINKTTNKVVAGEYLLKMSVLLQILFSLLTNRLPFYFKNSHKMEFQELNSSSY